jgi:hypothetical protein
MDEKGNVPIYYGLLAGGRKKNKKMIERDRERKNGTQGVLRKRDRDR